VSLNTVLNIIYVTAPFAIAGGLSYLLRDKGPVPQFLLWVFGLPALFFAVPLVIMIVSFQVFGIDLVD
jgi:hypothetical protein